jgi:hypothetical protein
VRREGAEGDGMTWQPIETAPAVVNNLTAPHDVLLYGPQLGVRTGRAASYPDGIVFAGISNINGNVALTLVTHWMPLPEPPK